MGYVKKEMHQLKYVAWYWEKFDYENRHNITFGVPPCVTGDASRIWGSTMGMRGHLQGIRGNTLGICGDITGVRGDVSPLEHYFKTGETIDVDDYEVPESAQRGAMISMDQLLECKKRK